MPEHSRTQAGDAALQMGDFARDALSTLAEDVVMRGEATPRINKAHFDQLFLAVTAPDRLRARKTIQLMLADGISVAEIADNYIPRAAEVLGEAWCSDQIDFAATTIGSARLQGILRSLGPEWCGNDIFEASDTTRYCVVVPEHNQHTLGAMLVTGQLRRRNVSVDLEVGVPLERLETNMRRTDYDAVLVSAYTTDSIEAVHKVVSMTRDATKEVPIVVGGGLLDLNPNIKRLTGCDMATNDLDAALTFCNSRKPHLQLAVNP